MQMYLQQQRSNQMMFNSNRNQKVCIENNIMQGYSSDDENFSLKSNFVVIVINCCLCKEFRI